MKPQDQVRLPRLVDGLMPGTHVHPRLEGPDRRRTAVLRIVIGLLGVAFGLAACSAGTQPVQQVSPGSSISLRTPSASPTTLSVEAPADESISSTSDLPLMVQVRSDLDGSWRLAQSTFGTPDERVVRLSIRGRRASRPADSLPDGVSENLLNTVAPALGGLLGWSGGDGCNGFQYRYDEEQLVAFGTLILCPGVMTFVYLFHLALKAATSAEVVDGQLTISAPIGELTFERAA